MGFHDNRFHLIWTPLLRNFGGKTLQAVGVVCPPSLGSGGRLTLRLGGRKYTARPDDLLSCPPGHADQNAPGVYLWEVPRPSRPVKCQAEWKTPLGYTCRDVLEVAPAEESTIHVVLEIDFDRGSSAVPEEVLRQCRPACLDQLLEKLRKTAKQPLGQRLVWVLPASLLEQWLDENQIASDRRGGLEKYVRSGRVAFGLQPFTPHSDLLGLEEMCRTLYSARRLAERLGASVPSAARLTDVPAHTASMAMALRAAGGSFLQIGTNPGCRGPDVPQLFWWKLPDGSRILCHYSATPGTTLLPPPEYPYQHWLALQVARETAGPADQGTIDQAQWITEHFDSPVCQPGRLEDFAQSFVRAHGRQIPTLEGEPTDGWVYRIAGRPGPAAMVRRAKDRLPAAEIVRTLGSLATGKPIKPDGAMDARGYQALSRYAEHTGDCCFARHESANDADRAFSGRNGLKAQVAGAGRRHLPVGRGAEPREAKAVGAVAADAVVRTIEAEALERSGRGLAAGRGRTGILLFNVASWRRGGLVRMSDAGLPRGEFELLDAATGSSVLYLRAGGQLEFIAPLVPACGYLYLEVRPVRHRSLPGPEADWNERHSTLHFESYVLQFHAAGGMCRWHDRGRSMQWCSNKVDSPLGTFLYEMPGGKRVREFTRRVHGHAWGQASGFSKRAHDAQMTGFGPVGGRPASIVSQIGALRSQVVVEAACLPLKAPHRRSGSVRRYRTTFTVYRGCRDLHVRIELAGKQAAVPTEAGYGFFPFYGSDPLVLIDRIAHLVEPTQDFMGGVNTAQVVVHRGVRIELEHAGMNFYPLDTPLVGFGAPGMWNYDEKRQYEDGVLYATLFADGGGTGLGLSKSGEPAFEFVCRPTGNDEWDGGLARGGLEVFRPIVGTVVRGAVDPVAGSVLRIEPDLVHLVTLKPAEFGGGTVLRLWSADPDPLTAELALPFARGGDVLEVCDLLERPSGKRIPIGRENRASVGMAPHAITTLLLRPAAGRA